MSGKVTRSLNDRFWEKVEKTTSCWNWIANKNRKGYGRIWVDGRNEFAQRVAFTMLYGQFNKKMRILHCCDNPSCVNPKHLYIGTDADNGRDKAIRGRAAMGEKNGNSKLKPKDIIAIRRSADSYANLARTFGIDRTQVWNIKTKRQWKHL